MNDIMEELLYEDGDVCVDSLRQRAADEIGRLRGELKGLREAGAAGLEMIFDQLALNNRLLDRMLKCGLLKETSE